jgi:hypothetical protein
MGGGGKKRGLRMRGQGLGFCWGHQGKQQVWLPKFGALWVMALKLANPKVRGFTNDGNTFMYNV